MPKRKVYLRPEPETKPATVAALRNAPARKHAPDGQTEPPPPTLPEGPEPVTPRMSRVRTRRRPLPSATVDEVTADLSKDPRRE